MAVFQFSALSDGQAIWLDRTSTRAEVVNRPHAGKDITLLNIAPFQPQFRSQHGSY